MGPSTTITMGLLLALDSITTSSPLGSITRPGPTPRVPHWLTLPLLWYGWTPILFLQHIALQMALRQNPSRKNSMISHMIMPQTVHFSFHYLVTVLFLGQNMRSRSADLYLRHFPFQWTITSNDTSLYSIVVFLNLPPMVTWVPS